MQASIKNRCMYLILLGSDEIVVLTQFNGTFKICVNSMSDPPEDLYRKIANVTGLPTTMMTLYIWNYEK